MIRLSQHKFDENNMPIHLMSLISTLRKYPQMLELEGIFRKSGSIEEEEEIIQELSQMTAVGVLKQPETGPYCGYAVAGVVKKLFTKLDHPIVPYATYNKVMALQGIKEEDEIDLVKDIIYSLPTLNRNIVLYVINFIRNQVLTRENNKMNFYSMSVVLSPCFFRPEVSSLQDLLNSGRFASIINILFKKFDDIIVKQ